MIYDLRPEYGHAKSFYRKAFVRQTYTKTGYTVAILYSYGTPVCAVGWIHVDWPIIYRTWAGYSHTTQRHIDEFLRQNCWDYNSFNEERTGKKGWAKVEYKDIDDALEAFHCD